MGLPKMFNKIFFQKIDLEKKGKISKKVFLKYLLLKINHNKILQGPYTRKRYFQNIFQYNKIS